MPNVAEIIREHVTLDVKCVDPYRLAVARGDGPGAMAKPGRSAQVSGSCGRRTASGCLMTRRVASVR